MRDSPRSAPDSRSPGDLQLDPMGGGDGYIPEKAGGAEETRGGAEGAAGRKLP